MTNQKDFRASPVSIGAIACVREGNARARAVGETGDIGDIVVCRKTAHRYLFSGASGRPSMRAVKIIMCSYGHTFPGFAFGTGIGLQ